MFLMFLTPTPSPSLLPFITIVVCRLPSLPSSTIAVYHSLLPFTILCCHLPFSVAVYHSLLPFAVLRCHLPFSAVICRYRYRRSPSPSTVAISVTPCCSFLLVSLLLFTVLCRCLHSMLPFTFTVIRCRLPFSVVVYRPPLPFTVLCRRLPLPLPLSLLYCLSVTVYPTLTSLLLQPQSNLYICKVGYPNK